MRQYVGARYVPLIMGEWNNQQVYEPLSVVSYLRSSYTSKKTVPAGIVPTNTEYWALTGNYAGTFDELQGQINTLSDTVAENKNLLDTVNTEQQQTAQDLTQTQQVMNENFEDIREEIQEINAEVAKHPCYLCDNEIIKNYFGDNAILVTNPGISSGGWLDAINNTDKEKISQYFIIGGKNDYTATSSQINDFINLVSDLKLTYVLYYDVWWNKEIRTKLYDFARNMELSITKNIGIVNLVGIIRGATNYTNGLPNNNFYNYMKIYVENAIHGYPISYVYNLNSENYVRIDNHIALFYTSIIIQYADWTNSSFTVDLETIMPGYINPSNYVCQGFCHLFMLTRTFSTMGRFVLDGYDLTVYLYNKPTQNTGNVTIILENYPQSMHIL